MHNDEMREILKYFMDEYVEFCYSNLNFIFTNPTDIHVADSVLHIFETRADIEDFNKKRLYILIRERTGLDPSQTPAVTRVVKVLEELYKQLFVEYERTNFVNLPF
jgi:hypothetical protein